MDNENKEKYPVPKEGNDNSAHISNVNVGDGDVFIGNKTEYNFSVEAPKVDPKAIMMLVEQYKDVDCKDPKFLAIKEELDDYNLPRKDRPIVGLEGKLKAGARSDLYYEARLQKDKFAKRLSRYEFSAHHCAIHLNLLGRIEERFNSKIRPLIDGGAPNEAIDHAISELIIEPFSEEVSPADPTLTAKIVRGMLFLLTGNCYLRWSKNDSISPS
ncbi:hypothetical protein JF541_07285 [Marinobacter hydrocarbonoclasticus]|uniref:ABC-three component system protein n=1 Tax=Marinobacter nauticus TaxID=2743 RepID=UPI001A8D17E6|nr:ABC-three component system protein [Marinobacter nauticus]MBN8238941.1 hypothetical protein [Marinobacter nauticus]